MSRHNTIRASLTIAVAALAIGAGSAGAMPMREGSPALNGPHAAQLDPGQASLAQEQSATVAAQQSRAYRIEHGTAPSAPGPVPADDGTEVPLLAIVLGLAGTGVLGAGAAGAITKTTRSRRARVA